MIDRKSVLDKCGGRCGYCGCEIDLSSMQVDHMVSLRNGGTDDLENLMPACASCNHYKRAGGIEYLRRMIAGILNRLMRDSYIFKIAVRYGLVEIRAWDKTFYFEREKNK